MTEKEKAQELAQKIAEMQQELSQLNAQSAPPRKNPIVKVLLSLLGICIAFMIAAFSYMCFWPLNNDDEVYAASCEAHDALEELREYRTFHGGSIDNLNCDAGCPKCHPLTWRLHVRTLRSSF